MECRWLQQLAAIPEVTEVPAFSAEGYSVLDQLATGFGVQDAAAVKKVSVLCGLDVLLYKFVWASRQTWTGEVQVESVTNHDVKAIEYVIKERIGHNPELAKVSVLNICGFSC